MHKIIINIGLLVFFLAIIFFTRMGLPLQDILLRSIILFLVLTILMSFIASLFLKSVRSLSTDLTNENSENQDGK